ncbi:MAG: biopolymer transporter ExbD [Phycisphaeraceae bacterium]
MSDPRSNPERHAESADHLEHVASSETVHHESRARNYRPVSRVHEINLTPMLDVCFLLLIFFVLTASFALGEGILPADLPRGESAAESDEKPPAQPIEITLRSLGGGDVSIELVGDPSPPGDFHELYIKMRSMQATVDDQSAPFNADDPVIIHADSTVRWAHLVNAFNAAFRARYANINFAQPRD